MNILCLPTKQIYSYIMTGKFKAPSSEWKHQNFQLTDYELIVMTEGTLYLNYNSENFIVKNGEYLLLPPSSSWRQGIQPSYCAFYWLHFTTQPGNLPLVLTPDAVLPPPPPIFHDSSDRNHPQAGEGGHSHETTTGHCEKQISRYRFGCHVHKHPDRTLRAAHTDSARRKLFRESKTDLLRYYGLCQNEYFQKY